MTMPSVCRIAGIEIASGAECLELRIAECTPRLDERAARRS